MSESNTVLTAISNLLKDIVTYPNDLEIEEVSGETSTIINIKSGHKEDIGKLIGKSGRTIKALRVISRVIGSKDDKCVTVNIVD